MIMKMYRFRVCHCPVLLWMEANNKFLRFYRTFLARKNGQVQNLTDVFNRLWLKSDPCIKAASVVKKSKTHVERKYDGPMTKEEYYMDILTHQE